MARRKLISSGSPFEPRIGFSRAAPGDLYGQTRRCLQIIAEAIGKARLTLDSVIRTRVMLTDISRWKEAARAHGEIFGAVRPASTFVEVKGLINKGWLVEIEADCIAKDT